MEKSNKMALQRILSATGNPQGKNPIANLSRSGAANNSNLEPRQLVSSPRRKINETRIQSQFHENSQKLSVNAADLADSTKQLAKVPSQERSSSAERHSVPRKTQVSTKPPTMTQLKLFLNGAQSKVLKSVVQPTMTSSIKLSPKKYSNLGLGLQEQWSAAKAKKELSSQLNASFSSADKIEMLAGAQFHSNKQIPLADSVIHSGGRQNTTKPGILIETSGGPLKLNSTQNFGTRSLLESIKRNSINQRPGLLGASHKPGKAERGLGQAFKSPQPQRLLQSPSSESYSSAICLGTMGSQNKLKSGGLVHPSGSPSGKAVLNLGNLKANPSGVESRRPVQTSGHMMPVELYSGTVSGVKSKQDISYLSDGGMRRESSKVPNPVSNTLYSAAKLDGSQPNPNNFIGTGLLKAKETPLLQNKYQREPTFNYGLLSTDNKNNFMQNSKKKSDNFCKASKKLKGSFEKKMSELCSTFNPVLRNSSSGGHMNKFFGAGVSSGLIPNSNTEHTEYHLQESEDSCEGQLDSSIERIDEDKELNVVLEESNQQQETTVNDTTLIRKTEGSLSNMSKSNYNDKSIQKKTSHTHHSRAESSNRLGLFEDLVLKTRKETSLKEDDKATSKYQTYYMGKLIKVLRENKSLKDDSPPEVILYHNHFRIMTQSFELARNLKQPGEAFLTEKAVHLPPNHFKKKTLVLDLDETLVHSVDSLSEAYDVKISFTCSDGTLSETGINIRPGLQEFLHKVNRFYEIVIFTAAKINYANEVLSVIDPKNELITSRIFKDHCYHTADHYLIKDLRIIKNRDPSSIVIVDNFAYSYGMQFENGIPIIPYFTDKLDNELRDLGEYLVELAPEPDVRPRIKADFHVDLFKKLCLLPDVLMAKLTDTLPVPRDRPN